MIASVGPGFGSGLSVTVNPGCADVLTSARMGPLYTTGPIPKNYFEMLELRWSARVPATRSAEQHTRGTLPQAVQKDRPARPQRVKARGVPSGYVEGRNDARTTLADFFSSLLEKKRVASGFARSVGCEL